MTSDFENLYSNAHSHGESRASFSEMPPLSTEITRHDIVVTPQNTCYNMDGWPDG